MVSIRESLSKSPSHTHYDMQCAKKTRISYSTRTTVHTYIFLHHRAPYRSLPTYPYNVTANKVTITSSRPPQSAVCFYSLHHLPNPVSHELLLISPYVKCVCVCVCTCVFVCVCVCVCVCVSSEATENSRCSRCRPPASLPYADQPHCNSSCLQRNP